MDMFELEILYLFMEGNNTEKLLIFYLNNIQDNFLLSTHCAVNQKKS